ncbi:DMT family transporter [Paenibacillus alginolyticus]|uniref:DMT family transporter n=1 Tax=Paenibacillus alginolyticus TaxID=59839 RepID=UPI001C25487B
MVKSEKTIYFILAMVVISWGLNIVMVKYLTQFISPMLVAAIRMPLAGIVLLPFVFKKFGFYKPNAKQWGLLFLIGLTSIFFHQLFLAYGVVTTTATNASLILGLNPLTTALLASIFIGEKFSMRLGLGILFGFSGVVLVVTSKLADSSVGLSGWGDLIMLLSMLGYVVGALFIKKLSTTSIPNRGSSFKSGNSDLLWPFVIYSDSFAGHGLGCYVDVSLGCIFSRYTRVESWH